MLKLSVMHDLAVRMSFNPKHAANVAEVAATIAMDSTARDASGAFLDTADGRRPNKNIVICWDDAGEPYVYVADIIETAWVQLKGSQLRVSEQGQFGASAQFKMTQAVSVSAPGPTARPRRRGARMWWCPSPPSSTT